MDEKEIGLIIGKNIRIRRQRLGMSQAALGKLLGIAPQQVQKYESSLNTVSSVKLKYFAEILRCTVNEMYHDPELLPISNEIYRASHLETERLRQIMRDFLSINSLAIQEHICAVVHTMVKTEKNLNKTEEMAQKLVNNCVVIRQPAENN